MGLTLPPRLRLGCAILAICACAAAVQAAPAAGKPYPLYPELYDKARAAVDSGSGTKEAIALIDAQLKTLILAITSDRPSAVTSRPAALIADHPQRLQQLFCLREALESFAGAKNREMAVYLLDRPAILGRFLHALYGEGKYDEALGVLNKIKEADAKAIETSPEFCIAFAVVWRDFHPYWWVEKKNGPVKPEQMMDIYKHFTTNRSKLAIDAFSLPYELAEYVVGIPVSSAERDWVMKNYGGRVDANAIYPTVPWTEKLSPANGFGGNIEYTLMNIKKFGGVCMEQAYFTEQVLRIRGIPSAYMCGNGERGGHAWSGEFRLGARPKWDFTAGRYRYDHYYQGGTYYPPNSRRMVNEPTIMMTGTAFTNAAGAIEKIEKSNYYRDAAMWVVNTMPMEKTAPTAAPAPVAMADGDPPASQPAVDRLRIELTLKVLKMSLDANQYNCSGWLMVENMSKAHLLDSDQALTWGKNLIDMTLGNFPEYSVSIVGPILECIKDDNTKLSVYSKMGTLLAKRPDLASEVKVAEGDVWVTKGDLKMAIQCYIQPMVAFSKDDHVLGKAKQSLEKLDDNADDKKIETACMDNLKLLYSNPKRTPEQIEASDIILKKLVTIYDKRNDDANADKYRKMISK